MPFFVMVFLAKGFVAATPLIVRGYLWEPDGGCGAAIVSGSAGGAAGVV